MRKFFLLLLCMPLLVACGDSDNKGEDIIIPTEKVIAYKFNTNATPTGTNNLIGVQIYKNGDPYAYGLFDDVTKIKTDFAKSSNYKIVSSIVIDGKSKIAKDNYGYLKPFSVDGKGASLDNKFIISKSEMVDLGGSTSTMKSNSTKSTSSQNDVVVPPIDRYYGIVETYSGDSSDNPVIDMERQVFGIRFNVEFVGNKIQPDDCLYLAVKGAPDTLFIYAKDEVKSIEAMYTFSDFVENKPSSIELDVYHRLPNGEERRMDGTSGEVLYKNDLKILDHQVIRDDTGDRYPYVWSGISKYYISK